MLSRITDAIDGLEEEPPQEDIIPLTLWEAFTAVFIPSSFFALVTAAKAGSKFFITVFASVSGKYAAGIKGAWLPEERKKKFIVPETYIGASVIGIAFRTENTDKIKDFESFAKFSGKLVPIPPQSAQWQKNRPNFSPPNN
jgi:hypothetical protein